MLRSIPFLIFIFILIPINRFLFKTAFGNLAATLPLALVSISIYTRFVEQALQNVDNNIIDNESFTATEKDIVENKKKVKLVKVSLLNLNEAYKEKDLTSDKVKKIIEEKYKGIYSPAF